MSDNPNHNLSSNSSDANTVGANLGQQDVLSGIYPPKHMQNYSTNPQLQPNSQPSLPQNASSTQGGQTTQQHLTHPMINPSTNQTNMNYVNQPGYTPAASPEGNMNNNPNQPYTQPGQTGNYARPQSFPPFKPILDNPIGIDITSMIVAIVSVCTSLLYPLLGFTAGIIAYFMADNAKKHHHNRYNDYGRKLGIVGMTISIIVFLLALLSGSLLFPYA